jgi:hypothetical protein
MPLSGHAVRNEKLHRTEAFIASSYASPVWNIPVIIVVSPDLRAVTHHVL